MKTTPRARSLRSNAAFIRPILSTAKDRRRQRRSDMLSESLRVG
jgi:hypothetical protein